MGLPGKPDGIAGADVERYFREGRIQEIANYCETDVANTYRIWLRYELFRGSLNGAEFEASERNLAEFINARASSRPHLAIETKVEMVVGLTGEGDRSEANEGPAPDPQTLTTNGTSTPHAVD